MFPVDQYYYHVAVMEVDGIDQKRQSLCMIVYVHGHNFVRSDHIQLSDQMADLLVFLIHFRHNAETQ